MGMALLPKALASEYCGVPCLVIWMPVWIPLAIGAGLLTCLSLWLAGIPVFKERRQPQREREHRGEPGNGEHLHRAHCPNCGEYVNSNGDDDDAQSETSSVSEFCLQPLRDCSGDDDDDDDRSSDDDWTNGDASTTDDDDSTSDDNPTFAEQSEFEEVREGETPGLPPAPTVTQWLFSPAA